MANTPTPAIAVTDDHRRLAHQQLGWFMTPFDKAMTLEPQRRIIETRAQRIANAQARAAMQSPQPANTTETHHP